MSFFEKTAEEQKKIDRFREKINHAIHMLEPYEEQADISELRRTAQAFDAKIEKFYSSERKLHIGVIGQVKAGKSTFLNTLLFDGKEVLPSARTPKTAVLTKIEYSEQNELVVEYYSRDEWQLLEQYAESDISDNEHDAAREIMNLAHKNGIDPYEYIDRKTDRIEFESSDDIMKRMNDYVGAEGSITPVVKCVTIHINRPELEDICVVDTPGLNDAIVSRTDQTRKFIGECDVVFFLSRLSNFLDKNDEQLITSQLPRNGVENLILIGSQLDGAILDELYKKKDVFAVFETIQQKLTAQAVNITEKLAVNLGEGAVRKNDFIEACRNPLFISSILYNASCKEEKDYNANEKFILKRLNGFGKIDKETMHRIGNIDTVREKFDRIVAHKDEILQSEAKKFVPNGEAEYKRVITEIIRYVSDRLVVLQTGDRDTIEKQRKYVSSQISGIKSALENVLGELNISIDTQRNEGMRKLRDIARENSKLEERQGTEWHTGTRTVGGIHFLCFSLGGHKESYSYSTTYTYLAASDALENIRNFSYDSCSEIEGAFLKAVDIKKVKKRLLDAILENFDDSDESFDINSFRYIVEKTLNKIEFPVFSLDVSSYINEISGKFSGEVRNSSKRAELQNIVADTISRVFEQISGRFKNETDSFRNKINVIKSSFENELLTGINEEYNKLQKQFENKEREIQKYNELLEMLNSLRYK